MVIDTKNINIEVSKECWTKLKIVAVSRDVNLHEVVREILERSVSKKVVEVPDIN
jgi:hypothetical protein